MLQNEKRAIRESMNRFRDRIDHYNQEIESEQSKSEEAYLKPRQQALAQIEQKRGQAEAALQAAADADRQAAERSTEIERLRSTLSTARSEEQQASSQVMRIRTNLENAQSARENPLNAFGRGIPQLCAQIERETWIGTRPIGPIGRFVKVKDPRWCNTLETIFGPVSTRLKRTFPAILSKPSLSFSTASSSLTTEIKPNSLVSSGASKSCMSHCWRPEV